MHISPGDRYMLMTARSILTDSAIRANVLECSRFPSPSASASSLPGCPQTPLPREAGAVGVQC